MLRNMFPLMLVLMQISSTQATTIHHQKVVRIDAPSSAIKSKITHFEVAPGIGAATVALDASVAGKLIHVFPVRDLGTMDEKMKSDPNYPFKQVNVPLFPLTNRLMPANYTSAMKLKKGDEFTAEVEGIKVKMPLNNVAAVSGAIPHHLHGLVFDQEAKKTDLVQNTSTAKVISTFEHFFRNFWTADARLTVEQSIEKGVFHYQLTAVNTGTTAMPVGFGSHPYFQMPSGSATGVKLRIPATQLADIDNLSNVMDDPVDTRDHLGDVAHTVTVGDLDAHDPGVRGHTEERRAGRADRGFHAGVVAGDDARKVGAVPVAVQIPRRVGLTVERQVRSRDELSRGVKAGHRRDARVDEGHVDASAGGGGP